MKNRVLGIIALYRVLPNRPLCPREGASCSELATRRVRRYGALLGGLAAYLTLANCLCLPEDWSQ